MFYIDRTFHLILSEKKSNPAAKSYFFLLCKITLLSKNAHCNRYCYANVTNLQFLSAKKEQGSPGCLYYVKTISLPGFES